MKLTLVKSDGMDDWYIIERAEHDGRAWFEPNEHGASLCMSSRFSDADVEGTAGEMLAVAAAIRAKGHFYDARRCSVNATSEPVRFESPRNSMRDGECSYEEALELAGIIENMLAVTGAKP